MRAGRAALLRGRAALLLFVPRPALPWRYSARLRPGAGPRPVRPAVLGLQLGMTAGMASVVMQTPGLLHAAAGARPLLRRAHPTAAMGWAWCVALLGLLAIGLRARRGARPDDADRLRADARRGLHVGQSPTWWCGFAARHTSGYDPLRLHRLEQPGAHRSVLALAVWLRRPRWRHERARSTWFGIDSAGIGCGAVPRPARHAARPTACGHAC